MEVLLPLLRPCRILQRANRFVVEADVGPLHLANTGRLTELLLPGTRGHYHPRPAAKTRGRLYLVEREGVLVGVDATLAGPLLERLLRAGRYGPLEALRREVGLRGERLDFWARVGGREAFFEAKNANRLEGALALFPDAPTSRGARHLRLLAALAREGYGAFAVWLVQHPLAEAFALDPADRVPFFATLNEPWCSAFLGHWTGEHAPGLRNLEAALRAAHHLLLGHGLAVEALRAAGAKRVGIVLNFAPVYGEDPEAVDVADRYHNRYFLDPILGRGDPESPFQDPPPVPILSRDLELVARPLDFLGVNYYAPVRVAPGTGPLPVRYLPPEGPVTAMGWEVYPEGLYHLLKRLGREVPWPLYITENGAAYPDLWTGEAVVEDPERVAYLEAHVEAALRAREEGVDLRGYFVWSLMDNFEWAFGYTRRFGLYYVDFPSQRRIPKRSALWYRERIARAQL